MATILLTGATGFIGQHLGAFLEKQGHQIVATTRRRDVAFNYHPLRVAKIGLIDANTDWTSALEGVEVVVHLAARVHIMREKAANPSLEFSQMNAEGTLRLAQQAAESGVRRFVFLSSIKVNGEETKHQAFSEQEQSVPQDPYARSKWEAEKHLLQVAAQTGLEVSIIRPPLVYGAGVRGNFLSLLKLAHKGWPLPLASIDNRRSLVGIQNLCSLIELCGNHPRAAGEVFLVSDGQDVSTPELIRLLAKAMGQPCRLFPFPASVLESASKILGQSRIWSRLAGSLQVDISKARQQLGWEPPFSLERGLVDTVDWYRKTHLDNE